MVRKLFSRGGPAGAGSSAGLMSLPEPFAIEVGGKSFPIVWSIVGAALFVAILGLLTRARPSA